VDIFSDFITNTNAEKTSNFVFVSLHKTAGITCNVNVTNCLKMSRS
jgi:hypothetical protein